MLLPINVRPHSDVLDTIIVCDANICWLARKRFVNLTAHPI